MSDFDDKSIHDLVSEVETLQAKVRMLKGHLAKFQQLVPWVSLVPSFRYRGDFRAQGRIYVGSPAKWRPLVSENLRPLTLPNLRLREE